MFSYARFSFISVQYGSRSLKLPWNRWSITVNIGCVCFMPLHGKAAQPWCSLWWIAWFKQVASLCKLMCAPLYSETCRTQGLPGNKQKGSDLLSFAETLLKLFSFYPSGWWSIAVNPPGRRAAWTPKFVNMITRGGDIGFWNIIVHLLKISDEFESQWCWPQGFSNLYHRCICLRAGHDSATMGL